MEISTGPRVPASLVHLGWKTSRCFPHPLHFWLVENHHLCITA